MIKYSKLKEKKVAKKSLYRGVVGFNVDTVKLINGKTAKREYLVHNGASSVLAIIDGKVLLVQQFRYPVGKAMWEIPAGKIDKKETPISNAKRELLEETGYTAKNMKKLLVFYPCCAFSDEVIHIYYTDKLVKGIAKPDDDEFLNIKLFPLKTALKMIDDGKIKDAKTIIALQAYRNLFTSSVG
ncbi:MAG: NUDIX hydrolase [Elusimicrobiaceae bacterium]|nr:NUDIX hydrolase [Elusimicrobiaceae bacterium]MBT3955594.1 NUDIX hydrolase [Elusimicrobiaceae bacterium]MBT4008643.1 NUDIX hydrolase [Elusimicrobiaceae bacterium]MBT4402749.1 NUDIX hydrolase [Elusimicrobiaceae bacterium]MBT4439616.1 NUDIX hydrolase [Elusimicrobiaceae bacterium]